MDLNYRTNFIFPVPLHQFDVNGFDRIQDKLIDYAYCLKRKDLKGRTPAAMGGRIYRAEGGLTEATERLRRQGLGMGGSACIQIKGFGKARRPNK